MGDPWDDQSGPLFPEEKTDVETVEAFEKEIDQGAITKPHDSREWLAGFNAGKHGRVTDVLQALIAVRLEDYESYPDARIYAERVRRKLQEMEERNLLHPSKSGKTIGT